MNRCENCNIYIYDDTEICPLCHSILADVSEDEKERVIETYGDEAPYPDVTEGIKRVNFAMRLLLFIFILTEVAAVIVNLLTTPKFLWCLLSLVGLAYIFLFLRHWIKHDSGYSAKIGLQIFMSMVLMVIINVVIGKPYWSLEWCLPGMIILGDVLVFIFMLLYRENWFSYILLLVLMVICSVILWVLFALGFIKSIILLIICSAISGVFLLVVAIFKDREVKRELKRRFHV